jgi:hypothetical protein
VEEEERLMTRLGTLVQVVVEGVEALAVVVHHPVTEQEQLAKAIVEAVITCRPTLTPAAVAAPEHKAKTADPKAAAAAVQASILLLQVLPSAALAADPADGVLSLVKHRR